MTSPEWEAANEDDSDRFPQTSQESGREAVTEAEAYRAVLARAGAAEAKVAKVEALADEWATKYPSALMARGNAARFLRAVLADAPAEQRAEGGACADCGHLHTPDGCTGSPTPSDVWAGVSPAGCDCDSAEGDGRG